ncbi:MAG: alpha/beta hydrolase domain-containing protein [Acetobacteraceae bacterium]
MGDGGGVYRIEITERETPVFGGAEFDGVGAYERLHGTAFCELDPAHDLSADIVNLDKAPRNARGRVEYQVEFRILKPIDLDRGNGWLLYDVPNRGNQPVLARLNGAPEGGHPQTAGNGFLMRHGFTIVWSAWQGDVAPGADRLVARFPIATGADGPLTGMVREEFIAEATGLLGDANIQETSDNCFVGTLTYPVADRNAAEASLTVRQREADPRAKPQGLAWRLLDDCHVEITRPAAPGFDRGGIYEFIYRARDPMVMGIGFAAIRDIIAFLRNATHDAAGDANPLAPGGEPRIRHALGFGISQSGRVLRDLLHYGFNQDLAGRKVFDAMLPVVGGSRRTCVNSAFAQPGRYSRQHEDHSYGDDQFPFSYPTLTDPISGRTAGILQRARDAGVCPKVMHLDTESDAWQARSSLVVTDTGGDDIAMPDDVRVYLASGVQHAAPRPMAKQVTQLPGNPLGYGAFMRSLLIALVEWVEHDVPPPDSRFPSRTAGTLVSLVEARVGFPALPSVNFPTVLNELRLRDHSVEPPIESTAYPVFVPSVDADGNAACGVRHPLLDAPLATHTGWALRAPGFAEGDLFTVNGSMIPFAVTEAERQRAGDPRPSIAARYASREAWADRLGEAATRLVADRLLLQEDADRLMTAARESWDVFQVL